MGYFASRFCDDVGDQSGSVHLNVNGSVTPVVFKIIPVAGEILYINRMIWTLSDTGSIDSGGFGNGVALTNGIKFEFKGLVGTAGEFTYPQATFLPIKTNGEWVRYCGVDVKVSTFGTGDEYLSARYTFTKDSPNDPPWLSNDRLEELWVTVQDDLSAISDITCRFGITGR